MGVKIAAEEEFPNLQNQGTQLRMRPEGQEKIERPLEREAEKAKEAKTQRAKSAQGNRASGGKTVVNSFLQNLFFDLEAVKKGSCGKIVGERVHGLFSQLSSTADVSHATFC